MQRIPAGLPFGMPGIELLIDGAVQHAPQLGLQSICSTFYQINIQNDGQEVKVFKIKKP